LVFFHQGPGLSFQERLRHSQALFDAPEVVHWYTAEANVPKLCRAKKVAGGGWADTPQIP
jgi:hypothetical protein